jgi:hypothetical protein
VNEPDHYLLLFLAFFFPDIHADIDWSVDWESLEQELRAVLPTGLKGRRLVDKLIKVMRQGGEPALLHVEFQGKPERGFKRRVYIYNSRADDRYNPPVGSVVVLGDSNPSWRPTRYLFKLWGCRKSFTFRTAKLLDWAGKAEELEKYTNPFALLILAHLQAQATRQDEEARTGWKLRLVKGLYARRLDAEDVRQWFRCIDRLLTLSPEAERRVWQELSRFEEERRMAFITSVERIGLEKGRAEGLQKGIELALELKFGAEGLALLSDIRQLSDPALLQAVLDGIRTAGTPADVRRLLPPAPPASNGAPAP